MGDVKTIVRRAAAALALVVGMAGSTGCVPMWNEPPPADFYDLPSGGEGADEPAGTLERVQRVTSTRFPDADVYRVAYWTTDRIDRPQVATGIVSVPRAAAPAGGRPFIAYTHGTTGMAPQCAPSRAGDGFLPAEYVRSGLPVVAPDYIGLGPVGKRHSYLSGVSEARATIDLVRAAADLPRAGHDGSWYVIGHSQGGHAALFTGEEAPSYAPELDLKGVVAGAPPTGQMSDPAVLGTPVQIAFIMALVGMAEDHPGLVPEDYFSPAVEERLGVLDTGCLNDIVLSMIQVPGSAIDVPIDQRLTDAMVGTTPGHRPIGVPIHVFQGDRDPIVWPQATRDYVAAACARGEVVQYAEYPTDHNSTGAASAAVTRWLLTVESGAAAPTTC
jgi:pimeloyl-ACP methyl ester carboxylesterase